MPPTHEDLVAVAHLLTTRPKEDLDTFLDGLSTATDDLRLASHRTLTLGMEVSILDAAGEDVDLAKRALAASMQAIRAQFTQEIASGVSRVIRTGITRIGTGALSVLV